MSMYPDPPPHRGNGRTLIPRKRTRKRADSPGSRKGGSDQESNKATKVRAKSSGFPCPFFHRDPLKYGGDNGCADYSRSIETVIRHHVLGKHRKEFEDAGHETDIFEEVKRLAKESGWGKYTGPGELWKSMYRVLFKIESSEEDSIPEPSAKPNPRDASLDDIQSLLTRCVRSNPSFAVEVGDLIHSIDSLRTQRRQARHTICQTAAERIIDLNLQISAVRDKQATDEKRLEAYYDQQLSEARSCLKERLTSESQVQPLDEETIPPIPSFDIRDWTDDVSYVAPQENLAPHTDEASNRSAASQAELDNDPNPYTTFLNTYSASTSDAARRLPSDEGYQSLDNYCVHRVFADDPWCDACVALYGGAAGS